MCHVTFVCPIICSPVSFRVYAHIEQESSSKINNSVKSPSRSLISSSTRSSASPDGRVLTLRLRADSLVHTHSSLSRVVPKNINSKPDTYYEISRPSSSSSGTWITVYRSPTVKESVSPLWDEAMIELSSFSSESSPESPEATALSEELSSLYPVMITIYKVKRKKCKEIGSFETTVESLIDACQTASEAGYDNDEQSSDRSANEETIEKRTFQLRHSVGRRVGRSYEVTGNITVTKASIETSNEAWKRSERFLSDASENDEKDGESLCAMSDEGGSCSSINRSLPSHPRPKFSDYVRSGTVDIDLCVAIDFTSSNGDPRIPGTQHYSRGE